VRGDRDIIGRVIERHVPGLRAALEALLEGLRDD